jgi:hypothetical protein
MICKEPIERINIDDEEVSDNWLIKKLKTCFDERLNEPDGIQGIDVETAEIKRDDDKLMSATYLNLTLGVDEEAGEVRAIFFNNSLSAASIKVKVK